MFGKSSAAGELCAKTAEIERERESGVKISAVVILLSMAMAESAAALLFIQ